MATQRAHPEVVIHANDRAIREALGAYAGEAWAYQRHARQPESTVVLPFQVMTNMEPGSSGVRAGHEVCTLTIRPSITWGQDRAIARGSACRHAEKAVPRPSVGVGP